MPACWRGPPVSTGGWASGRTCAPRRGTRACATRAGPGAKRLVGPASDLWPARGPSPLEALLEDERARIVREALGSLAPLHREVLILVEYEDLDLATVAEIVGTEVGAVKVRLHRARRKLRAALEAHAKRGAVTVT